MKLPFLTRWATVFALSVAAAPGFATVVHIDYYDINPPNSPFPDAGGPHWTGYVNTATNTLTIQTWDEITGSDEFWTPLWTPDLSALPLVWRAFDFNGDLYDVPDTFDGAIDATFAFISEVSARNMLWNEGTFSLPEAADFFPGWGGVRRPVAGQNPVVLVYDTSADERTMPMLPKHMFGFSASTFATVTATIGGATTEGVPEASAWMMGLAASSAAAGWTVRRRLVRRQISDSTGAQPR